MKNDTQKVFSLAAVIVAAILFGMLLSGGLDMTSRVEADRSEPVPAAAPGTMMLPDFAALADHVVPSVVSVYSVPRGAPVWATSTHSAQHSRSRR